ncbi:MAG: cob(I)yrinic acid a,c-diamide adenosyltransferase [Candidatus Thermoplasmatota archaeon]|nr:cob(I)yrinic acid a,c-diamide adenosyltransferase [Candidatus Thermoplasmatota archaeon]
MFTRKGDSGETDRPLAGRVSKGDMMIEIEGEIDFLISLVGFASTMVEWQDIREDLEPGKIDLFTIGEEILTSGKRRVLDGSRVSWLETRSVEYKREAGKVRLFIVPGGSQQSAILHVARTSARSLERIVVRYKDSIYTTQTILSYLNRLSSLIFMHAVLANKRNGISERIWDIGRES